MTRVYKLYHSTYTTGSAVAYLTIQRKGRITGIQYAAIVATGAGGGGGSTTELSFVPSSAITTHDAIGVIAELPAAVPAASQSGGSQGLIAGLNIPVEQTDRIYAHVNSGANVSSLQFNALVFVEE